MSILVPDLPQAQENSDMQVPNEQFSKSAAWPEQRLPMHGRQMAASG